MVNSPPPTISLSSADESKVLSTPTVHTPASAMTPVPTMSNKDIPKNLKPPATSLGDSIPTMISPHNSALLEPQVSLLPEDVFNVLSELLLEQEPHPAVYDGDASVNLSLFLLGAHSGTAASYSGSCNGRRVRSGSLFSTNSIWNDDAFTTQSPDRSVSSSGGALDLFPDQSHNGVPSSKPSSSSFLSPNLIPQPASFGFPSQPRNRSHTTSGLNFALASQKADAFRSNFSPFLHSTHDDLTPFIDNFDLDASEIPFQGTRNRSQTYSGTYSKVPQSSSPNVLPGASSHVPHSASQNMHSFQGSNMNYNSQQNHNLSGSPLLLSNVSAEPFLQDEFNFFELQITTNFENPSLGPTNTLLFDNVPRFLNAAKLYQLLSQPTGIPSGCHHWGVLSIQVTLASNSKMALIVCRSIEVAMNLKANFNHLEIIPGIILYVAFAKIIDNTKSPLPPAVPPSTVANGHSGKKFTDLDFPEATTQKICNSTPSNVNFTSIAESIAATCGLLAGSSSIDLDKITAIIAGAIKYPKTEYKTSLGALPDSGALRQMDAPKIRELRKSLEANEKALQNNRCSDADDDSVILSQEELESLAIAMLDELPELCYDHIGNTVVQKLFTVLSSSQVKLQMVKRILPYFAQLGTHKNGTWAIQKIINLSQYEPEQKVLIAESIRPYSVKLFNDQFGNYVLQCCLKFGSPYNDFIFEAICTNFMEISSGRFGVRCIRTILETLNDSKSSEKSTITREQLILVSSLIVEYAHELAIGSNGSLLITWFLDTFHCLDNQVLDTRASLLCKKLMPFLEKLCTHKLANVTIFKLLNNKHDISPRQKILDAIFSSYEGEEQTSRRPPTKLLEGILRESHDNNAGPMFIQKVLSYPSLFHIDNDSDSESLKYQQFAANQVKRVLLEMNISNTQPYKKLMDEVGLNNGRLSRTGSSNRKAKRGSMRNGQAQSSYHGMLGVTQVTLAPQMAAPVGFCGPMNDSLSSYVPYGYIPAYASSAGLANDPRGVDNTRYLDRRATARGGSSDMKFNQDMHFNQDAHVMRQLEQLSLQSAAMGYASNPGTPIAGMSSQNQNLFF